MRKMFGLSLGLWATAWMGLAVASDYDELKIKRKDTFEFAAKPVVKRQGIGFEISFESKANCDATVAIQDGQGRIVRHLASGVLGSNAPLPFKKDSMAQALYWDGKDDQGRLLDNLNELNVRVSLGLKPAFEKNLFWNPKRRHGRNAPIIQVAKEGVYVYDGGNGLDFVKLYDHQGTYLKTLYPFPGSKIDQVKGLPRQTYPQDGKTLPVKPTFLQQTFLTSGNTYGYTPPEKYRATSKIVSSSGGSHYGMYGNASTIMAVRNGRIALGRRFLFRFATDGSSGGMDAGGPPCFLEAQGGGAFTRGEKVAVAPRAAALSPDGETLYLTGYNYCNYGKASNDIVTSGQWSAFHCVLKMQLNGDKPPELFAGDLKNGKAGTDQAHFKVPSDVAVDAAGRVFVADYMNDRVQIYSPQGKFLKSLGVKKPARISINAKTQELYVFTGLIHNIFLVKKMEKIPSELTVFGPFEKPGKRGTWPLPKGFGSGGTGYLYSGNGFPLSAAVDGYTNPPTVWLAKEWQRENVLTRKKKIQRSNVQLHTFDKGKFTLKRDFEKDVIKAVIKTTPARYARQRLYVNPKTGKVYIGEGETYDYKAFKHLIELDPQTSAVKMVDIPFDAEDACFDHDGHLYMRNINTVVRYEFASMREVPWDYGEERAKLHTSSSSDRKEADVISGLSLPAKATWHHGGLYVTLRGNLVVAAQWDTDLPESLKKEKGVNEKDGRFQVTMYPGRKKPGRTQMLVHVFDKYGKPIHMDAAMGLGDVYGVGMDERDGIYVMSAATRIFDGKRYLNDLSGTMMKFMRGKAKILVKGNKGVPIPLTENQMPKRKPDVQSAPQGAAWLEGAEWTYGGVGFGGKNRGTGCACWNARFSLDYFARSFAPEMDRFQVAVLDANGNLILRVGRYGNVDSSGPKSAEPLGGDEVGLMHGAYVATHTDKRLFIADPANGRILSVSLNYHANEVVSLADTLKASK